MPIRSKIRNQGRYEFKVLPGTEGYDFELELSPDEIDAVLKFIRRLNGWAVNPRKPCIDIVGILDANQYE